MADQLGLKRWKDAQTGMEVRQGELVRLPKKIDIEKPAGKSDWIDAGNSFMNGVADSTVAMGQGLYTQAALATGAGPKYNDGDREELELLRAKKARLSGEQRLNAEGGHSDPELDQEIIDAENRIYSIDYDAKKRGEQEYQGSTLQFISEGYQKIADDLGKQREQNSKFWGVDKDFQDSFTGQLIGAAGGMVPQALTSALPGLGVAAMQSQAFQLAMDDAKEAAIRTGQPFDADKAFAYALTDSFQQALLEKVGLDTSLGNGVEKAASVTFKTLRNRVLKSIAAEGGTEALQGATEDALASGLGIEQRDPLDPRKRATEIAIGGILGGGLATVETASEKLGENAAPAAPAASPKYNPEKTGTFSDLSQLPAAAEPAQAAPVENSAPTVKDSLTVAEPLADDDAELDRLTAAELADLAGDQDAAALAAEAEQELAPVETDEFGGELVEDAASDEQFAPPEPFTPEKVTGLRQKLELAETNESGFIDTSILSDVADYGRTIWKKGMEFLDWSMQMVRDLGEKITPHLRRIFEAINGGAWNSPAATRGSVVVPSMESTQQAAEVTAPLNAPPDVRTDLFARAKEKLSQVIEQVDQQTELLRNVGTDTSRLDNTAEQRLLRIEQEKSAALESLQAEEQAEIEAAGAANLAGFMDRIEAAKTSEARTALRRDAKAMAKTKTDAIRTEYAERRKAVEQKAAAGTKLAIQERNLKTNAKDAAALRRAEILGSLAKLEAVMSVLPSDVRGRVGGARKMASLTTDAARLEYLKDRVQRVAGELETMMARIYDRRLQKLFKRARPAKDKAGKLTKGKAGADVHSLFRSLETAKDFTPAEADARVDALEAQIQSGELTAEEEASAVMEMNLIPLVSDWENKDAAARAAALDALTVVFERGYVRFQMRKADERDRRKAVRAALVADTGKTGTLTERKARLLADSGLRGMYAGARDWLLNLSTFEQTLRYVFGANSREAQRLTDMERRASNAAQDGIQAKMEGVKNLFTRLAGGRLAGEKLQWRLSQPSITANNIRLSELEGITATLLWRQEDGKRHMLGQVDPTGLPVGPWHYNQDFVNQIERQLSPEARQVRDYLTAQYGAEYATLNPVYRELNGIDLPKNENYAPITVKPQQAQGGQSVDPVTGTTMSANSVTPGSLRRRGSSIAEPDFRDALQTYLAHTKQIEHWKAYAPFSTEAQSVLNNREVSNAAEAKAGDEAVKVLRDWLDYFAQGGVRDTGSHLAINRALNKVSNRGAAMALIGRAGTIFVQSTQLGAALAEMPTTAYLRRMGGLLTGQMGWKAAIESPYIQRRLREMPPVVRQAVDGLKANKPNAIKHGVQKLGQLIGGADALFTAGTYAMVYDYKLAQGRKSGLSGAELEAFARNAAERATDRIAQPTRPGARSLYENTSTNPLARTAWAFASEARKNIGLIAVAFASKDPAKIARTITFVWILNALAGAAIRSAWRDLRDDDDDEVLDEKNWSPAKLARAFLMEPVYGVPVLGDMAQSAVAQTFGDYNPGGSLLDIPQRAIPSIKRLPETLAGKKSMEDTVKDAEAIMSAAGLANDTIAAATSLAHVARDLVSISKNFAAADDAKKVVSAGKKFAEFQKKEPHGLGEERRAMFAALVTGDAATIKSMIAEKVRAGGDTGAARETVREKMAETVRGLSPLRVAAGSVENIPAFRTWAQKNLKPEELAEIDRMQGVYQRTAAGLAF